MATIKLTGLNMAKAKNTVAGDNDVVALDGSLTIGNADTDAVIFQADIDSDILPDDDDTFDLGSETKKWGNVFASQGNFFASNAFGGFNTSISTLSNFSGVTTFDCSNGQVFILESLNGNFTPDLRNLSCPSGMSTEVRLLIKQRSTPYSCSALQIEGSSVGINWLGGSTPSPVSNAWDIYCFFVVYNGTKFEVFGKLESY